MPKKTTAQKSQTKEARHAARKFKAPKYKTLRLSKRIKPPQDKLPAVWVLMFRAWQQLNTQRRVFLGITIVYGLLMLIFVRGLSGGLDAVELKANVLGFFEGGGANLGSSLAVFGVLVGSASSTNGDLAALYQTVILVVMSLTYIWAFRQTSANPKQRVRVKEAFYNACQPIIQFIIVLFAITLQLLPLGLGNILFGYVIIGGFAATPIEKALWYILIALLMLLTIYMVSSSFFALFVVTLPGTKPMQALKAARELVRYRRWNVMRKIFVLPIVFLLLLALITLPSILIAPGIAEWIFFSAVIVLLPLLISYMYALYKALLA